MTAKASAGVVPHADDLVEDRELDDVSGDALAHDHLAQQLFMVVTTVPDPANVALYGPWGSGKSGIANLLRKKVGGEHGVRFARFDAFKYAENPMRRNFVSAIANELDISKTKYHEDLYSGKAQTQVVVPFEVLVSASARLTSASSIGRMVMTPRRMPVALFEGNGEIRA